VDRLDFAAGTLALGASAYFYFVRGRERPTTAVVPVLERDGGGIAFTRTF
jgi:hypothetical protein